MNLHAPAARLRAERPRRRLRRAADAPAVARCCATSWAHRHQGRLRRRRLRRLHGAARRRAGLRLPDAGGRRRGPRGHDRRGPRQRPSCRRCRPPSSRMARRNAASARRACWSPATALLERNAAARPRPRSRTRSAACSAAAPATARSSPRCCDAATRRAPRRRPPAGRRTRSARALAAARRPAPRSTAASASAPTAVPADALVLLAVRSPHHRARASPSAISTASSRRSPGIAAVFTAADIPGRNCFGVIPAFADQPALAEAEARFRGEAVALRRRRAHGDRRPRPRGLPGRLDAAAAAARRPATPRPTARSCIHADRPGNVLIEGFVERGDADAALAAAAHAVAGTLRDRLRRARLYRAGGRLRPRWTATRWSIRACTQAPYMDRDDTAAMLGLPPEKVRIVPTATGGGFGSKLDISVQPLHRPRRAEDRPAGRACLHARRIDDVDHQAPSRRDAGDDRRRRRGPAHRHGLRRAISTPAPMRAGARRSPTACRSMPPAPMRRRTTAARAARDPHPRPDRRRLPRLRRAAGDDHAGDALRRAGREARPRPARVPPEERASRRLRHRHRPGARSGRRHRRLPRSAAAALARARWPTPKRSTPASERGAARRRRRVLLVRLRQHLAAQSLDHQARHLAGRRGRAAPGRGRYRPGLEHRDRPDLRRRARPAARGVPTDRAPTPRSRPTPARPRPRGRPSSPARPPRRPAARCAQAILRFANVSADGASCRSTAPRWSCARAASAAASISPRCRPMPTASSSRAEETYDPPTTPLDAKGQGKPYAVYGYGAQIAELEVDMRARHGEADEDHRRARCRQGDQPDAGRRPDRGRHRAGHRHGADGGIHPRPHREPARLSDPDHRRRAADRDHPGRGSRSRRAVRRQGPRRACADPDRAGDPQRHPPCDRRAGHHGAGDADPRARGDHAGKEAADERACRTLRDPRSRRDAGRRKDPLRCLSGHVLHRRRAAPAPATATAMSAAASCGSTR